MTAYLAALTLTLVLETPVYALGLPLASRLSWRPAALAGVEVNLVSHVAGFLVVDRLLRVLVGPVPALIVVELGVFCLEAILVGRREEVGPEAAWAVSAIANVASLTIGVVVLR